MQYNQYYVNISLKNNQDEPGWISETYLETINGNSIDLTEPGIDKKINSKETLSLLLFSAEVSESLVDSPFTFHYIAFPSGNSYSVNI